MTRTVTRILVPTDFSAPADAALEYARLLAERLEASIHLLPVFEGPHLTSGALAGEIYVPMPEELRRELLVNAGALLQTRLNDTRSAHIHASSEICNGPVAKTIADYAASNGSDLIVMGTHGRGGMAHLLLGSVAEHVI